MQLSLARSHSVLRRLPVVVFWGLLIACCTVVLMDTREPTAMELSLILYIGLVVGAVPWLTDRPKFVYYLLALTVAYSASVAGLVIALAPAIYKPFLLLSALGLIPTFYVSVYAIRRGLQGFKSLTRWIDAQLVARKTVKA